MLRMEAFAFFIVSGAVVVIQISPVTTDRHLHLEPTSRGESCLTARNDFVQVGLVMSVNLPILVAITASVTAVCLIVVLSLYF